MTQPLEREGLRETAPLHRLAPHLAAELQHLMLDMSGKAKWLCPRGESGSDRLMPVLRAYARILQADVASNLSATLAWISWLGAIGEMTPEQVLDAARRARRQKTWSTPEKKGLSAGDGGQIDARHIAKAAAIGKRGPKGDPLVHAANVYRVIAWNSRADVKPTLPDRRKERAQEGARTVMSLIERQREVWLIRQELAL